MKTVKTFLNKKITEVILIIVIKKNQKSCKRLFLINNSINYYISDPKILYFYKHLIQNFRMLKYGLLIKILIL